MRRRIVLIGAVLFVALGLCFLYWCNGDALRTRFQRPLQPLTLSGNVDDRQVNLAFMVPERIEEIRVEEGDNVHKGDLLGRLETIRIKNRISEAEARVEAAQAALDKAINGNRKEDIDMSASGVDIVKAQMKAAENDYERTRELATTNSVSKQEADNAEANYFKLQAQLRLAENNLSKMKAGSRAEDIAAAKANLEQAKAVLNIQKQNLKDTELYAPCDGIVRNRILEPGEMATPQSAALVLAIVSPKWVRVYLSESLLTRVRSGDKAQITVDGLTREPMEGWVGSISPNAEFTPKNVETKELRTALVYEVRVYVKDPGNILKLGGPADVTFPEVMVRP